MKRFFAALLFFAVPAFAQIGPVPGSGGSGSGGITSGAAATGCTAFSIVYVDTSGNLACASTPINGSVSTAGRSILTIRDTATSGQAFLDVTGTSPTTLTTAHNAVNLTITGAGSSAQNLSALTATLAAGYTGSANVNTAARFYNATAGTGAFGGIDGAGGNVAVQGYSSGGTGAAIGGVFAAANSSGSSTGLFGIGVNTGIYGCLGAAGACTIGSNFAAGIFDSKATGGVPLIATVNGAATSTAGAAAYMAVLASTGQTRLGPNALTSATMTPTIVAEARSVSHSYAWTNAQVVALGAVLTGDITVATLPAKTRVDAAYIVIDTAAAGPTTLTVSCGDALGGTPFVNLVKPGDAKAAANTVYGDSITGSETGTSLFSTFFIPNYVPSYTATTLVTCHFIATVANLSTVTTSTGRLILSTTLLP